MVDWRYAELLADEDMHQTNLSKSERGVKTTQSVTTSTKSKTPVVEVTSNV